MKRIGFLLLTLSLALSLSAQTAAPDNGAPKDPTKTTKRGPVFRATKDQIKQAQTILKDRSFYRGEQTGKLDEATRDGLNKYQIAEDLKITGTLNKETLEKMNISLTDPQKGIPKPPKAAKAPGAKDRPPVFRATKDQIKEAQTRLKEKSFYGGDASGKLDENTRQGLKKYQAANGIKVTGTLNRETLEKMSIQLTEKQKTLQLPQKT